MEPIPIKMKVADPEAVTARVVEALKADFMLDDLLRNQASEIWRTVSLAMAQMGCIVIQPDNADPT